MQLPFMMMMMMIFLLPVIMSGVYATPIAPVTLDGATPIDAQISAADFGALDAFAEDAAESSAVVKTHESSSEGSFKISLLPTPAKTAESVNLEHEGIGSKIYTFYDVNQKKLVDISHPTPILDGIEEHEKYGNNGDMFDGISRSLVNGYEAFSNLLNTFIQKPKDIARSISKGITAQLDVIGGKLVGL